MIHQCTLFGPPIAILEGRSFVNRGLPAAPPGGGATNRFRHGEACAAGSLRFGTPRYHSGAPTMRRVPVIAQASDAPSAAAACAQPPANLKHEQHASPGVPEPSPSRAANHPPHLRGVRTRSAARRLLVFVTIAGLVGLFVSHGPHDGHDSTDPAERDVAEQARSARQPQVLSIGTEQESVLRLRVRKPARGATPGGADERDERTVEEDTVSVNPEPVGTRAGQ